MIKSGVHFLRACVLTTLIVQLPAFARQIEKPLTSQELVRLVYQLSARSAKKEDVISEIRRRGIGFPLTGGIRSLVASKSGSDADLRRTLEEAERRRVNPAESTLPPEAEGEEVLRRARESALAAADEMPDFVVKQIIKRSFARGSTKNWRSSDQLTVAVSYRGGTGEQYKLLAVNGLPAAAQSSENNSYEQVGGTSSTGEYVSMMKSLFDASSQSKFKMTDTDLLRERRTIVYEFEVKKENSQQMIKAGSAASAQSVVTGYRGRLWLDRENYRVLRIENISTDIPADFPVTAASSRIDYDWVMIAEQKYLLPVRAEIVLTSGLGEREYQSRNEIRFRNYQKYGSEVKILEDDGADLPEEIPNNP
ncbi:MAG: hypothetical protein WKF30_02310 [Pyrinomonadaceae bacterium]